MSDTIQNPIQENKKGQAKQSKQSKQSKQKRQEVLKMNVPIRTRTQDTFKWLRYIHLMMKEANKELLTKPNIITAYNALVDSIEKYEGVVHIAMPYGYTKYVTRIDLMDISSDPSYHKYSIPYMYTFCMNINNVRDKSNDNEIMTEIMNTFSVLYELIKCDIVPYMERIAWEKTTKQKTKSYMRTIGKYENKRIAIMNKYKSDMAYFEKQIAFYAEKLRAVQAPCIKTEFPSVESDEVTASTTDLTA